MKEIYRTVETVAYLSGKGSKWFLIQVSRQTTASFPNMQRREYLDR